MKKAVQAAQVPHGRIDDHVRRIVRGMFATGVMDDPVAKERGRRAGGLETAQRIAEQSMVLLKNEKNRLPLDAAKVIVDRGDRRARRHRNDLGRRFRAGGSSGGNAIMPPGQRETSVGEADVVSYFAFEDNPRQSS